MISQNEEEGQLKNGNPRRKGPMTNAELTALIMKHKENRNQFTVSLLSRIDSLGDSLVSKCVDMAMEGNEKMLSFLLDKLINTNLLNRLEKPLKSKTVEDIDNSSQIVVEKMGDGTMDLNHGEKLMKALSMKRDTINVKELESQVRKMVAEDQK